MSKGHPESCVCAACDPAFLPSLMRAADAEAPRSVPGVHLSWTEAVRVVPDLVATEAERIVCDLDAAQDTIRDFEKKVLYAGNSKRDALIDLGEAIERLNRQEWDLARDYVRMAMNVLQGKGRREGL